MSWESYGKLDVLFRLIGILGTCCIAAYWIIRMIVDDRKNKRKVSQPQTFSAHFSQDDKGITFRGVEQVTERKER